MTRSATISFFCASISAMSAIVPSGASRLATSTSVGRVAPSVEPAKRNGSAWIVRRCTPATDASAASGDRNSNARMASPNRAPHRDRFFMIRVLGGGNTKGAR
jgi:hypothetical protein